MGPRNNASNGSDREDYAAILANNVDDPAVTSADTLEELADKLGFDKQAFLDCIAVYNAAKDTGVDAAFGARVELRNPRRLARSTRCRLRLSTRHDWRRCDGHLRAGASYGRHGHRWLVRGGRSL